MHTVLDEADINRMQGKFYSAWIDEQYARLQRDDEKRLVETIVANLSRSDGSLANIMHDSIEDSIRNREFEVAPGRAYDQFNIHTLLHNDAFLIPEFPLYSANLKLYDAVMSTLMLQLINRWHKPIERTAAASVYTYAEDTKYA